MVKIAGNKQIEQMFGKAKILDKQMFDKHMFLEENEIRTYAREKAKNEF
jgi:hypothetical protein